MQKALFEDHLYGIHGSVPGMKVHRYDLDIEIDLFEKQKIRAVEMRLQRLPTSYDLLKFAFFSNL